MPVPVVPAVSGDPLQHRPLHRHRPEDGEDELDRAVGVECMVREQPVIADGDPDGGQKDHPQQEAQVRPSYVPLEMPPLPEA